MRQLLLFVALFFALGATAQTPLSVAEDFTGTDIHGEEINLFSILDGGQYVLIDFFYTTCGPCNTIAPYTQEAYEAMGCNGADVVFLSVDQGNTDAECLAFDEQYGIEFPCLSGVEGGGNAICSTYGISAYPTVILIAPNYDIVIQDLWPIANAGVIIAALEGQGLEQAECGALTANFQGDLVDNSCIPAIAEFENSSIGTWTSLEWTFEGGDPATSTEENPSVTYTTVGSFDVSLTITDGTETSTILLEDYIETTPELVVTFEPIANICINYSPYDLTEVVTFTGDCTLAFTGDGVSDEGIFDPAAAGLGAHDISVTCLDPNTNCEETIDAVITVDACVGVENIDAVELSIMPNPATSQVKISADNMQKISVYSISGQLVFSQETNQSVVEVNLSDWQTGVYLVKVVTEQGIITNRLVVD